MKLSNIVYHKGFIWVCLLSILGLSSCQEMDISDDLAGFDPNNELISYVVDLTGPGQTAGERIIDVAAAKLYTLETGSQAPEKVDFLMLWGASSNMNLVSPSDINRLAGWGTGKEVNANWLVKNETTFMKFDASQSALWDDIKQVDDVKKAYDEALSKVQEQENYDVVKHGPAISIRGMEAGDIVFFKTEKGVYAAAKVLALATGNGGSAKMAFKVDKRAEAQIDPISNAERIGMYQVKLEKPGFFNTNRFLDAAEGIGYSNSGTLTPVEEHAFYHQEMIDFVFLNSASSGGNLISISDADHLSNWGTGTDINQDWLTKNEGTFVKLDASEQADSIFLHTFTRSKLHEAYAQVQNLIKEQEGYEVDLHGPGGHVSAIAEGDLIFFQSTSKNILAMYQVTEYSAGASGSLELSAKVDNSEKIDIAPSPDALNYGSLALGGWSASGPEGDTYHVDLARITRFDPASADASQNSVDLLNLWSGAGFVNFMTPTSGSVSGWGSSARILDWNTRNDGVFILLSNPTTEEKDRFEELVSRDLLVQAFEQAEANVASRPGYVEENNGPSIRIRHVSAGDIVYFKSNAPGRNLYAAIEVKSVTPGTSNGREVVEIFVKSNLLNE